MSKRKCLYCDKPDTGNASGDSRHKASCAEKFLQASVNSYAKKQAQQEEEEEIITNDDGSGKNNDVKNVETSFYNVPQFEEDENMDQEYRDEEEEPLLLLITKKNWLAASKRLRAFADSDEKSILSQATTEILQTYVNGKNSFHLIACERNFHNDSNVSAINDLFSSVLRIDLR